MARKVDRLSARFVEKHAKPGYYLDGAGLYLQISSSGSKSWIFLYTRFGKQREMGMGSLSALSLAEAREDAGKWRKVLAQGKDPIEVRDADKAQERARSANSVSFDDCAEKYITAHRSGWRNEKHVEQWRRTLKDYASPVIGSLPVSAVETAHVLRILEPIWTTKSETASRVRGRIEHVLDWAKVRGYRAGENPARWRGHLDKLLPKKSAVKRVEHLPALPYAKLGDFMRDLRKQPGVAARALELAILCASRSGEVRFAKPAEFDLEERVWTVPAERMKAKKQHRAPLSDRAVAIVKEAMKANPGSEYVFPGAKEGVALSDMSLLAVLRRMNRDSITVHGFRSTFKDWASETTSYANELSEMALAHAIGSDVEAAYRRGDLFDKRRRMMAEWSRFCDRPSVSAQVTPIRKTRG